MPAKLTSGDLFKVQDLPALAHGCTCAGAMGKGIAAEFRRRWPAMYEEYRARCANGTFSLGDVFVWQEGERTIFNLATQRSWRTKAEIEAIEEALHRMVELAEAMQIPRIGLPRIGAGLGGLEWARVRYPIERVAASNLVTLIVFEVHEPADTSA
jgi:O-acetyl-ADP-ribose deacetylase (regulator of RNase III)